MNSSHVPNLGLVCITASEEVRYRTVTRKSLLQLDEAGQRQKLTQLYQENIVRLNKAISFCRDQRIRLYRITSDLFPFADTPLGEAVLETVRDRVAYAGERALGLRLRMVIHPDQFVVLSSDSPQVVENSIKILQMHAHIMDMLRQPRSAWAPLEIHGGKGGRSEQLIAVTQTLPEAIRSRLVFENDEHSYSAAEILAVCQATNVPMVFDAHHHIVHEKLTSYADPSIAEVVAAARETWPTPAWQMVHLSNGRTAFGDRSHHDLITDVPPAYCNVPWIEVEAKGKEIAIQKLRAEWQAMG
ncbi:MAG: UV DNA damage repair endonuclease UvsE [Chloroflexota bacterium]|nr:UV DNA damage repair endonuclease UvsE [Chloroflexota bacterium]